MSNLIRLFELFQKEKEIIDQLEKLLETVKNNPLNVYKTELKQHEDELNERKNYRKSVLNDERIKYLQKQVKYLQQQVDAIVAGGEYAIRE